MPRLGEDMDAEYVAIPLTEYLSLQEDARWREKMEGWGIDNWIGYDDAISEFYREEEDND